jgi:hypothetical protein
MTTAAISCCPLIERTTFSITDFDADGLLDLWAVLYQHQIDRKLAPFLELLDVVSLWIWDTQKVRNNGHVLTR